MSDPVSYSEIHAYMLRRTRECYQDPPEFLVQFAVEQQKAQGRKVSIEEARKLVSLIDIQRYVKLEMEQKWPEFMASIPTNSLQDR